MTFYEKFVQIELCLPWASNSTTAQNIIELDISGKKAAVRVTCFSQLPF